MSFVANATRADRSFARRNAPLPPAGEFELGLVLAGAVAAGAYTAGVLSYVLDALDAWEDAKNNHPSTVDAPPHRVRIPVVSGASAGALSAALLARLVDRRTPQAMAEHPLYSGWVDSADVGDFFSTSDVGRDPIASLLNGQPLEATLTKSFRAAAQLGERNRTEIFRDLSVILSLTNLEGVAYWSAFRGQGSRGYGMATHRDHLRFAVGPAQPPYLNERALDVSKGPAESNWPLLRTAALASGAFPGVFRAHTLPRPADDYAYRVILQDEKGVALRPLTPHKLPERVETTNVDGGAMNNEPLELAREVLAGRFKRNPRGGLEAKRAVVLVDPFPEPPAQATRQAEKPNLVDVVTKLANGWKQQARFDPSNLELADARDVYSRFLVSPSRSDSTKRHLAGGFFGGFGGIFSRAFREHDFYLGRLNARVFLECHLALPEDNPLFDHWSDEQIAHHASRCRPGHLPVIPLTQALRDAPKALPSWPRNDVDLDAVERLVRDRFDAIWEPLLRQANVGFTGRLWLGPVRRNVRKRLADWMVTTLRDELRDWRP
ncbi:MAG: patatin-like phospholipase family protein [Myxococcota bacterium]